ncbi:MAG: hypothetical protein C0483_17575 [Pirellula sp.]|nr:hypothetical protein [Pirellula sp.]
MELAVDIRRCLRNDLAVANEEELHARRSQRAGRINRTHAAAKITIGLQCILLPRVRRVSRAAQTLEVGIRGVLGERVRGAGQRLGSRRRNVAKHHGKNGSTPPRNLTHSYQLHVKAIDACGLSSSIARQTNSTGPILEKQNHSERSGNIGGK